MGEKRDSQSFVSEFERWLDSTGTEKLALESALKSRYLEIWQDAETTTRSLILLFIERTGDARGHFLIIEALQQYDRPLAETAAAALIALASQGIFLGDEAIRAVQVLRQNFPESQFPDAVMRSLHDLDDGRP